MGSKREFIHFLKKQVEELISLKYSNGALGDWTNTEIRVKYEKLKLHGLFNRSMEIVFQKIQKWGI